MGSISLQVRYRPIRIGWCVEAGSMPQLERAFRLSHSFSGGCANPVIPVNDLRLAESLVDLFRVDLLFPLAESEPIKSFITAHDYLHWPTHSKTLFYEAWKHRPPQAAFVDVSHAAVALRERGGLKERFLLPTWDADDPLALMLLAMFGGYQDASSEVPRYGEMLTGVLHGERIAIKREETIPSKLLTQLTPSRLTTIDLKGVYGGPEHGVYVGAASSHQDIVNFWNIRAAGAKLVFYDPSPSVDTQIRPPVDT